ncbi:flagellar basal body rod protein FlgB [Helicobacter sp. MIT 14-3879]|uniref:flagellar basal body rod protein FlgB n=1 Tax=Helicobacter sp. MIT 14-3879 TaxID=2040649 RepID=UPI000E1EA5C2|nr:flagellar basal body rod protein FlgB [Helicobacter sp. MIT 14-3879]RDU63516.1 flagellar basal body rod protein FlgB [Helicobacter sp. MIT 14-3879]
MAIFDISKSYGVVNKALDYRSLRQDLISSNISNISTPFYRPKDIHFETYLTNQANKIFKNEKSKILDLAQTNPRHLKPIDFSKTNPSIFYRDGHLAKNDGNSVDLDVETSELGKNSVMYNALINASKKHKGIFSYAMESSKNI